MSRISTHVLDIARGVPAQGIAVELHLVTGAERRLIAAVTTNAEGRTDAPLLEGAALTKGNYRLVFEVALYYRGLGAKLPEPPFLDRVPLRFGVADASLHYHVPLLCSPWGYTTYRGS